MGNYTSLTAVSDNKQPVLSKTGFWGGFLDISQTTNMASNPCLSTKGSNNEQKLPYPCFFWIWKLYRNNFPLGM